MAYQNVGTPRFYINDSHFMIANGAGNVQPVYGADGWDNGIAMLNVGKDYETTNAFGGGVTNLSRIDFPVSYNYNFCFILGHNIASVSSDYYLWNAGAGELIDATSGVNTTVGTVGYNGWTLHIFDEDASGNEVSQEPWYGEDNTDPVGMALFHIESGFSATGITKIKSVCIGKFYDMPHSPDLNLTMTREMDGVKRIRTKGGNDLVNHKYTKPPMWGDHLAAWELHGTDSAPPNQKLSRSGRRVWDLSFSYLSDNSIFPETSALSNLDHGLDLSNPPTLEELYNNTLLTDDNFYSQVIHKTNGGQLPFIFQPDSNDSNPGSGFAICKFDMKSFKFKQVSNGIYKISLKIREIW